MGVLTGKADYGSACLRGLMKRRLAALHDGGSSASAEVEAALPPSAPYHDPTGDDGALAEAVTVAEAQQVSEEQQQEEAWVREMEQRALANVARVLEDERTAHTARRSSSSLSGSMCKQDIELRAAWRCWLLACVLARVVLDEALRGGGTRAQSHGVGSVHTLRPRWSRPLQHRRRWRAGQPASRCWRWCGGGVASAASRADPRGVRDYFCSMTLNACRRKLLFFRKHFQAENT